MRTLAGVVTVGLLALAAMARGSEPDKPPARGTNWWSLQPVRRSMPPLIRGPDAAWVRMPIDAFILAKLKQNGLNPAPPVERASLIRRVTMDLTGLPPTPEAIHAFVADRAPQAYEALVDRLLASPQYGERWGRHWLDVVRFGESQGYETNLPRPSAWPYRDYVIRAFNRDTPFPRFVFEQLAGDVLAAALEPPARPGAGHGEAALPGADWLTQAATGFLVGGTHDIVGNQTVEGMLQQRADDLDDMIAATCTAFLGLTVQCARCHDHKFDPISQRDYYGLQAVFAGVNHGEREMPVRAAVQRPRKPAAAPARATIKVYAGTFSQPGPTHLLRRGDPLKKGRELSPSGLEAVAPAFHLVPGAPEAARRAGLAEWIADPANPLPARVMVNRLWQYHFGRGIVATPSDFGASGAPPSHPELLDWLAARYVAVGWQLKPIHRLIVLSATYQQTWRLDQAAVSIDRDNRLLWRMTPRRLEAEAIHDAILFTSGRLDARMGGRGYNIWENNTNYVAVYKPRAELGADTLRRMVYQFKPRSQPDPTFGAFDCPDAAMVAPRRNVSTTALQSLNLLNSHFVVQQAAAFSERLERDAGTDPGRQSERGFLLAFGRAPSAGERNAAAALIRSHGAAAFCRALYNANEFVYVP
jgi:hypothetical protein